MQEAQNLFIFKEFRSSPFKLKLHQKN